MTTTLNLDAPGAAEALAKCYRLLRQWATEARCKRAADSDTLRSGESTASATADAESITKGGELSNGHIEKVSPPDGAGYK